MIWRISNFDQLNEINIKNNQNILIDRLQGKLILLCGSVHKSLMLHHFLEKNVFSYTLKMYDYSIMLSAV